MSDDGLVQAYVRKLNDDLSGLLPEGTRFEMEPWTDEQIEQFKAEWERQQPGRARLLTPLPRRIRFRLWRRRLVDRAAIRLVDAGHYRAAERLWRAFGMWRR